MKILQWIADIRVIHSSHYLVSLFGHSQDSHQFSLLFSFIIINSGNRKMRMEEKSKENWWESWEWPNNEAE